MRAHLATLVEDFRRHSAETAVVAHRGNRRYATTYGELALLAGRFAAELERRGIGAGDRVVIWGENSAEWIGVFFGCMLRAVIAVPLDAAGAADFAARVIRDTRPKLVVGDAHLLAAVDPHLKSEMWGIHQKPGAKALLTEWGEYRGLKPAANPEVLPLSTSEVLPLSTSEMLPLSTIGEHLPVAALFAVSEAIGPHTPFQIVFTSGTTSEPRGIVHTHRNILVTLEPIEREMQKYRTLEHIFHPLRFLHSLPLSHVFGQFMALWIPGLLAAELHFAEQHEPSRIAEMIRREKISVLIAVPRVLHLLRGYLLGRFPELGEEEVLMRGSLHSALPRPGRDDAGLGGGDGASGREDAGVGGGWFGILKKWWRFRRVHRALGWKFWAVISGGATLPAELETFWNRLGYALIQGYGMTETAALITLNHPFHIKQGTIGKPMPGHEVRLTDEGEILVRGEMLTEATWQGGAMHKREGEWLATGDLAEANESGELRFLGRKGDVIVTGAGMNIHPADLEAALAAQPGVRAAVVVGCDLAGGTEAVAVVIPSGAELDAAVAAANRGLAEYQQIRRVLRWPELEFPYTSTGKLLRRKVAEWACGAVASGSGNPMVALHSVQGEHGAPADGLIRLIAEVTGEPMPSGGDAGSLRLSEDLHLDSLGRVQLQSALEQRYSLELEDDAVAAIATVGELRALMDRQLNASSGEQRVPGAKARFDSAAGMPGLKSRPISETSVSADTGAIADAEQHLYPRWPWSWPVRALRVVWIECVLRPLVWLLAAPRVTYVSDPTHGDKAAMNGAVARGGPLLVICNHITSYDGALALYALPGRVRRHVAAAMSGEMLLDYREQRNQANALLNFLAPGAYWLLTALFNVFPLPRARGFRRSFAHAGEAMDHGYSVLLFPEGTRSRTGQMNPFRAGIGLLAKESRVPILPVALVGLYEAAGETRPSWFHSGRVEIRIGELIPAADDATDPAALTARLEQAVRALG